MASLLFILCCLKWLDVSTLCVLTSKTFALCFVQASFKSCPRVVWTMFERRLYDVCISFFLWRYGVCCEYSPQCFIQRSAVICGVKI